MCRILKYTESSKNSIKKTIIKDEKNEKNRKAKLTKKCIICQFKK